MNVCKSCFLGHIMKISTIYLIIRIDFSLFVDRKLRNITDIKMLVTVWEKDAPMVVPLVCRNVMSPKLMLVVGE